MTIDIKMLQTVSGKFLGNLVVQNENLSLWSEKNIFINKQSIILRKSNICSVPVEFE